MYNLTNLTTAQNIGSVVAFANNTSRGILFGGALIAIFFVMLVSLKKWDFDAALIMSGWTCFVLGIILAYGGFVQILFPLAFLAIAAFSAMYMWASGRL
jgi:hypothetical protein